MIEQQRPTRKRPPVDGYARRGSSKTGGQARQQQQGQSEGRQRDLSLEYNQRKLKIIRALGWLRSPMD